MPRLVLMTVLPLVLLSACMNGSGSPGDLPDGTTSAIYTTGDSKTVASCIAAALHSDVKTVDDHFVVLPSQYPGLSYSIGTNRKGSAYAIQVAITGFVGKVAEDHAINACVVSELSQS